jgi:hypothetical protein
MLFHSPGPFDQE